MVSTNLQPVTEPVNQVAETLPSANQTKLAGQSTNQMMPVGQSTNQAIPKPKNAANRRPIPGMIQSTIDRKSRPTSASLKTSGDFSQGTSAEFSSEFVISLANSHDPLPVVTVLTFLGIEFTLIISLVSLPTLNSGIVVSWMQIFQLCER